MKYLIIYLEIEHMLNFLSQSEKGDFLDLMITYAKSQTDPIIENKNILNVFNFIRGRLDTQFEKARIKAEIARKNGEAGGRPPAKKATRKPERTQSEPKITQSVLPEFVNKELWECFVEMRLEKKKPLTERAIKLTIKDLGEFENKQKGFANLALENAIKGSWQGVFEPKGNNVIPKKSVHNNFEKQDYTKGTEGFEVC